jgi:hypothetical protein
MPSPRRVTRQQQQEGVSRPQFEETLSLAGWQCEPIRADLGEDLLVRIYSEGRSTGLSCYVQLKSTSSLEELPSPGGSFFSYPIPIKDLLHWEDSNPPVIIVVWDVGTRRGVWVSVAEAIKRLDASKAGWRQKRLGRAGRKTRSRKGPLKVAVHFPKSQTLEGDGLVALRRSVAIHTLPAIAHRKPPLELKARFDFSKGDSEAREHAIALGNAFATGASVDIPSQYVKELVFSEWWTRMFGEVTPYSVRITLESVAPNTLVPARVEVLGQQGTAVTFSYIELRITQQGTDEVRLSSEGENPMLSFSLTLNRRTQAYSGLIRSLRSTGTVSEVRNVATFLKAAREGCSVSLNPLKSGRNGILMAALPPRNIPVPEPEFFEMLDHLSTIENCLPARFALSLEATRADVLRARLVASALSTGSASSPEQDCSFVVTRQVVEQALRTESFPLRVRMEAIYEEMQVELFGTVLSLGPYTMKTEGPVERAALEDALAQSTHDEVRISLINVEVVREFVRAASASVTAGR